MHQGDVKRAAKLATESPSGFLRTADIIARFCKMPAGDAGLPAVLVYFQMCLDRGNLNTVESIELAKHLILSKNLSVLE